MREKIVLYLKKTFLGGKFETSVCPLAGREDKLMFPVIGIVKFKLCFLCSYCAQLHTLTDTHLYTHMNLWLLKARHGGDSDDKRSGVWTKQHHTSAQLTQSNISNQCESCLWSYCAQCVAILFLLFIIAFIYLSLSYILYWSLNQLTFFGFLVVLVCISLKI